MQLETTWIFIASQYIGVFAGYAGVVSAFIVLSFAAFVVIAKPIMAFRERRASSRRYDFLEMFDDDRYNEVMGRAMRAAKDHVMHMKRGDRIRGLGSEELHRITEGVDAAMLNLQRQMDKARARRVKENHFRTDAATKQLLESFRKLKARKAIIEAKERAMGITPEWDLKVW